MKHWKLGLDVPWTLKAPSTVFMPPAPSCQGKTLFLLVHRRVECESGIDQEAVGRRSDNGIEHAAENGIVKRHLLG